MSTPYSGGGFDKSEIRCLPGCAFWEDATGLMFLGYTREGGTLRVTANLDKENSHNILETMLTLNAELQTTFIFATHDEKVIRFLRRKISLDDGRVIRDEQVGDKGEIL